MENLTMSDERVSAELDKNSRLSWIEDLLPPAGEGRDKNLAILPFTTGLNHYPRFPEALLKRDGDTVIMPLELPMDAEIDISPMLRR